MPHFIRQSINRFVGEMKRHSYSHVHHHLQQYSNKNSKMTELGEIIRSDGEEDHQGLRICSEGVMLTEDVPPHVIGLTHGDRENTIFLLDTQLGIVH